ncbi:MAG: glycosyltransferase family 1 protein [Candidatus Veblenbacteria bacterium]|nr:glycosyltransferase family 1 protein [Candidatus Veblenbacteria bacterium]
MRILLDARLYGLQHRGLGRYLMELVRNLLALAQRDEFIFLVAPQAVKEFPPLPTFVSLREAPWRVYSLAEQVKLPRLIAQLRPDLVHFPHFSAPFFCPVPFVVTVHDLILHHAPTERSTTLPTPLYWLKVAAYHRLMRRLLQQARAVMTVSQAVAADLNHYYPFVSNKLRVIPLAPSPLPPASQYQSPHPYFLMVGAFYPHKNVERAVVAVAALRQKQPQVELWLVGKVDAFGLRLQNWVHEQGWSNWVRFWGSVSDVELAALLRGSTGYLLPSLHEGFGLGALDALAVGVPVVAADIPVLREVLGPAALYADPYHTQAIADQLLRLATHPELRIELTSQAKHWLKRYSWARTGAQTLALYHEIN